MQRLQMNPRWECGLIILINSYLAFSFFSFFRTTLLQLGVHCRMFSHDIKAATFVTYPSPILHLIWPLKFCITFVQFILLGITAVPIEIENNVYAECLGDK